jgi:hypothetical protein
MRFVAVAGRDDDARTGYQASIEQQGELADEGCGRPFPWVRDAFEAFVKAPYRGRATRKTSQTMAA